ncbi:MAG: Gfo/Idh/MocA family oxidoreductase [Candidatus Bathyarchaeum sp.]|nr:MAG: Gfo/Idh/MocA family oxidoreductase [Candidatus Bathyarchaeum sp.]
MDAGIVGCGFISGIHVNAWKDAGISVSAVCDLNEKTAMQFAEEWRIPSYYTSFSEMLKEEDLFAVSVCVPPKFHANIALEALEADCNLVVEKPFTLTTDEAENVLDALQRSSGKLTIIHSQLFEHSIFRAMKRVKAGDIGRVIGMDVGILHSNDETMAADKNHWCHRLAGGRFGETLPHPVYLLRAFLGKLEVKSVLADKLGPHPWMPFDELRVFLEAEGKKFGTIHISFNAPGQNKTDVHVNIYGTGGTMHAGIYPISSLMVSKPGRGIMNFANMAHQVKIWAAYLGNIIAKGTGPRNYSISHARIIRSFVQSLNGNGQPLVTPENGLENVQVVEQICEQIEETRTSKN